MYNEEKICAVICNWNRVDDLIACVNSVLKSTYSPFDLVVVDNGSDAEILEATKQQLPKEVTLLINSENKGGAGGFNRGLKYALEKGIYTSVWLLDNDVIVAPDCLQELVNELRAEKRHGIVGSLILKMAHPDILQELGAFVDFEKFERVAHLKNVPVDQVPPQAITVDYVPACSLLVDCQALKKVGLLDESYFLYFDDTEWCLKFRHAGYLVRATTKAKVWHKSGGTHKNNSLPAYYSFRNGIHFFKNNDYIMQEVFTALYITYVLEKRSAFNTILNALVDALMGVRGKAAKERTYPLDDNRFGCHFKDDFQSLTVLGDELEHHKFLISFLEKQKCLQRPVDYYTNKNASEFSKALLDWVRVKPLQDFPKQSAERVLCLCEHVLKAPSPLEELLEKETEVYFLDQYSNFYHGFNALKKERERYLELKRQIASLFLPGSVPIP